MNVRDSEVIGGLLKKGGYEICDEDKKADIIIFNTCSVRQNAEERVWSLIGSYKGTKIIGLVGCMAQNYKERAFEKNANISFVVGPQDIHKIPEIIRKIGIVPREPGQSLFLRKVCRRIGTVPRERKIPEIIRKIGTVPKERGQSLFLRKVWETDSAVRSEEVYHGGFYQEKDHGFVVVSEGCSNFCSYCVVPYVRGPLRHRKKESILKEIREALGHGITKITLLGQNVNAYRDNQVNFTGLLERINALEGLKELDFFTSHPKDATADLFKAIRGLDKLAKRLHLPLQSGSDRILKLMNRGYSAKEYLALIDSYRKIVKDGLLSTDIIVGFPTETDREFNQTSDLVSKVRFDSAYIFKYSTRPGTEAAKISEDLSRDEKEKRHSKLLDLQRSISNKLGHRHKYAKK